MNSMNKYYTCSYVPCKQKPSIFALVATTVKVFKWCLPVYFNFIC